MKTNMRILLVEDDRSLREGIAFKLRREGHTVDAASGVDEARPLMDRAYALAILDVGLPDGSGLDVCDLLRARQGGVHILFLSAQDAELDLVLGYERGGDDYMTKPFSLSVLMAKVGAVARRQGGDAPPPGALALDPARQRVTIGERAIELTRNEMRLMNKFLENEGQVLTKEQLLAALWDADGAFVDENTLAVNVRRLREKIEDDPAHPARILNVRGVGYRFVGGTHEAR